MPESADQVYKTSEQITADLIAAWQARIPDINVGPDAITTIWSIVAAVGFEGLYLGMQLTHDDMFIQTANALALQRYGEMHGRPQKAGVLATGSVRFTGAGGTYIPIGVEVAAPRASLEDALKYVTTVDGTIPNPGIPAEPTLADNGAGAMTAGTYEYVVTFVTAGGETAAGDVSDPLVQAINKKINVTNIPLGGAGTTARKLYRRKDGGAFGLVTTLSDNVTTVYADNTVTPGAQLPPVESTAERLTLTVQAVDIGAEYNVAIGTVTDISDSAGADLSDVLNLAAMSNGADEEDIETFRTELLKRVRSPGSGSPGDLESWAEEVAGVESATAFTNQNLAGASAPGTVAVRISATGDAVPDAGLIAAVQAVLEARDLANITIEVGGFDEVLTDVTVTVDLSPGFIGADVDTQVEQAITDYINSIPVGGVVYRSGIIHAIFGQAGIDTVTVSVPAADTVLTPTQKAVTDDITVNHV